MAVVMVVMVGLMVVVMGQVMARLRVVKWVVVGLLKGVGQVVVVAAMITATTVENVLDVVLSKLAFGNIARRRGRGRCRRWQ